MIIVVSVIGLAFILLVIFLIMALQRLCRVMKTADRVLMKTHHLLNTLSEPSIELIDNSNQLVIDIKKKSEALDVIFHPLYGLKKRSKGHKGYEKIYELLECLVQGVQLFSKIKKELK